MFAIMEPAMWEDLQCYEMKTDAFMQNNLLFSFFYFPKNKK